MTLLERYYGSDVMQLPPEEKRVNHAPAVIEFGPYTNELLDREELI
jgi:lipopolysaccharide cholinephosphotransferase